MKMAIIGHGFVGKAVDAGFNDPRIEKYIIDPALYGTELKNLNKDIDLACICLPTPMNDDGTINADLVLEVTEWLYYNTNDCLIVIKSTITPDVISSTIKPKMAMATWNRNIVYNPEFLAERNAIEEFLNPTIHVFGGHIDDCSRLHSYYDDYSACRQCPTHYTTFEEASFIKYGINCYLASKVMWFNQFAEIIHKSKARYSRVVNAMIDDPRIGASHTTVPGYDGKLGFGGACFPKDTSAFLHYAGDFSILEEVIDANNEVRKQYEIDDREKSNNIVYNTRKS